MKDLNKWLPDGVIEVDLELLKDLDLLDFRPGQTQKQDDDFTRFFHVVESLEKITLLNEDFVIWIVPNLLHAQPATFCLIAINSTKGPQLETGFCTTGVYNNSNLVLKVLEKFLKEIQETENLIDRYSSDAA